MNRLRIAAANAAILGLLCAPALWAEGVVTGLVLDGRTGMPVRGAEVILEGTDLAATTDLNGVFQLTAPAGTYVAIVRGESHATQKLTEVVITDGGTANVSAVLEPTAEALDDELAALSEEITVTAEAAQATEVALLAERQAAPMIIDNIGAEEIAKNSGSSVASALRRVTGVSLQDNKYVYVRGLGDRYSNTQLNGTKIPSTEFDRKVVPLDLFPSALLEKVTVAKSYTVDQPADFVAGVVELQTKAFPSRQNLSVGVGTGFNSETTGDPLSGYPGGLSFSGGGGQPLPGSFPDERLVRFSPFTGEGFTNEELEAFGEDLIGTWTPDNQGPNGNVLTRNDAPIATNLNVGYGNNWERAGLVLGGTWGQQYQNRDEERTFYVADGQGGGRPVDSFDINFGQEQVRSSLMGALGYRLGDNSQIAVRTVWTNLAESEGADQVGYRSDLQSNIDDFRVRYRDQEVLNLQLSGDHFLDSLGQSGSMIEWRGSVSEAKTDEDWRQNTYQEVGADLIPGEITGDLTLTNAGNAGFLYYNDLKDDLADVRGDWTSMFARGNSYGSFKAGLAYFDSQRDFNSRRFRFFPQSLRDVDRTLPAEEIFTEEQIGPNFQLQEITNVTDFYDGDQQVAAAYAQADYAFGKWRLVGGVRAEDNDQNVTTVDRRDPDKTPVLTTISGTDVLPSLSVVYSLADNQNLRGGYGRTLNRPEFRELAPFEFRPIVGGLTTVGNPDLVQAMVDSLDVRWEWFPSGGEVIAASVFYKKFTDPIEAVLIGGATQTQTYDNAQGATNQGFELEVRKRFAKDGFWEAFTGIVNYTYVDSEIEIDPNKTVATNPTRPLIGQPDHIANIVLEWAPAQGDTAVRLLYNLTGDRVLYGGAFGTPDVIENEVGTVDLVYRQGFATWLQNSAGRGFSFKASLTNLTDEERLWTQGGGLWRRFDPGRGFSFSVGYSF